MFKKKIGKKFIPLAVLTTVAFGGLVGSYPNAHAQPQQQNKTNGKIKNVIVLIGDGMGVSYTSAYRYLKDNPSTKVAERTAFDKYLVGQQMTYPEDPAQNVTDSASAATAMSAGVKTYNNAIAVDNDKSAVKTVLEAAKEEGKATGLVATSEITHATPASFGSHDESRKNMNAIADDYFDEKVKGKHKIDVLLGGGLSNFDRQDRNLTKEFKKAGYSYVTKRGQMLNDKNDQILGLFAPGGLPKKIDRPDEVPSLKEMTNVALNKLNKDKDGFFLMVEGSQIDWAGHDNDIVAAMSEMNDFEQAFQTAINFAKKDKHTLVVTTADHSTGGYSIGANGIYNWFGEPISAAKRTPDFMAEEISKGKDAEQTLKQYIDQKILPLSTAEIQSVKNAAKTNNVLDIDNAIEEIFNKHSNTGWTTGGHTGEDVPVYAFGPESEKFAGQINNTDIAKNVFNALKYPIHIKDK
ncbi:alkaline phosphatase [Fictibacillus enclensis]|uniref:alkaline phosphatase n=1 Tax=Fictibacillus enclensis TaxID=1017270 RepID=UPI0025A1AB56|nr:alkaline phosphatase [Fictibacillus enclensis]MDM5200528.1 alkaline phosphatase [Fictibacillus enclensis]